MELELTLYRPKEQADNHRTTSTFVVNDDNIRQVLSKTCLFDVIYDTMKLAVVISNSESLETVEAFKLDKKTCDFLNSIDTLKDDFYEGLIEIFSSNQEDKEKVVSFSNEISDRTKDIVEKFNGLELNS